MPKARIPGIPTVVDDRVLAPAVRALIEIVGVLTGQRGDGTYSAVTTADKLAELERRVKALEDAP